MNEHPPVEDGLAALSDRKWVKAGPWLDFRTFRQLQGVFHVDAEVADGALNLRMAEQDLSRILAGLMPDDGELLGLLALIELQASRLPARVGPDGALRT